jgi:predicted alpha/beta hydrolase family esterase
VVQKAVGSSPITRPIISTMNKRLFIIHGYTGHPDSNWFPWLKAEAEKQGFEVIAPAMPNTDSPKLEEWLPYLQEQVGSIDSDTYFIGHSLGCSTILRLLEKSDARAGGAVLVSGFAEPIHFSQLDSFTQGPWDDTRVRQAAGEIIVINSDNDPHVPLQMAQNIKSRFGAELLVLHDAGHINESSGHLQVPEILDALLQISHLK